MVAICGHETVSRLGVSRNHDFVFTRVTGWGPERGGGGGGGGMRWRVEKEEKA